LNACEVDVANQPIVYSINSHIDHDDARFEHVCRDKLGLTNGGNQDVC
jgi:hypothetical protein